MFMTSTVGGGGAGGGAFLQPQMLMHAAVIKAEIAKLAENDLGFIGDTSDFQTKTQGRTWGGSKSFASGYGLTPSIIFLIELPSWTGRHSLA
jgi:hypothetical protein